MIESIKSKMKIYHSKFGGVVTGFVIASLITFLFLFIRLIFYLERQLANSETTLRFDSLMDFVGFPLLVITFHIIIFSGIIIDGNELPNKLIQVSRKFNINRNGINKEDKVKNLIFVIEDKLLVKMLMMYLIGLTLFLIGHGLHVGTNFLNKFAIESDIKTITPSFYQQIWILDEIVSHWFLFSGLLILIFLLGYLNLKVPSNWQISSIELFFLFLTAIFSAFIWVILNVEGEYAWWGLVTAIATISYFSNEFRKFRHKTHFKRIANKYIIVSFIVLFFCFSIWWFIMYYLLFGGFIQPSDLLKELFA